MEFIGCRDQNGLNVLVLEHRLEAGVGVLDFQLGGDFFRAPAIDIGHGYQLCVGNQAAQVLRVHFSNETGSDQSSLQYLHNVIGWR